MAEHSVLLEVVRAAATLAGVATEPAADGILLSCPDGPPSLPEPVIPWSRIHALLQDDDPLGPGPRLRLALTLQFHVAVRSLGDTALDAVVRAARPLALPPGHRLHPGPAWAVERMPGGVLEVGVGVTRLLPGQTATLPLPPDVAAVAGLAPAALWPRLRDLLERLSGFALDRVTAHGPRPGVLRPVGGCDGLTLLASPAVRERLDGATVAAPRRDRVWTGGAAEDHGYVHAAWLLTVPAERGLPGPLRVTPSAVTAATVTPATPP